MPSLTKDNYSTFFVALTAKHGAVSLRKSWLLEHGYSSEYHKTCNLGIKFCDIAEELGLSDEFASARSRVGARVWTEQKIDQVALELIEKHGCIPVQPWLQQNGYGGFCHAAHEYKGGLDKLRESYYSTTFTKPMSRDGQRWDSWSESNVANFFWARGIPIFQGTLYPASYSVESGRKYGKYDLEFDALNGSFVGQRIFIEVWGDLFGSKASVRYAETRKYKEKFHADNVCFVKLHYKDSYKDDKLEEIFHPFIGKRPIVKCRSEHDNFFAPAQWSLSDEVMKISKMVCEHCSDKQLPPTAWFNKTGRFKLRPVQEWELKSWRGFIANVHLVGGFNKIRHLLCQNVLADKWTKDKVIKELVVCYNTFHEWPEQVIYRLDKSKEKTEDDIAITHAMRRLDSACRRFFDSALSATKAASFQIEGGYVDKRGGLPRGVGIQKNKKYYCQINMKGATRKLGTYQTATEAHNVYLKAKEMANNGATLETIVKKIRA